MQVVRAKHLGVGIHALTNLAATAPVIHVATGVLRRCGDVLQDILLRGCRREVERFQSAGRQGLEDLCEDGRNGVRVGGVAVEEV